MTPQLAHLSILPPSAQVEIKSEGDAVRLNVLANQQVTLIEKFESPEKEPYTTQSRVLLSLAPDAKVTHYKLVLEGKQATHQSFLEVDVDRGASFTSHVFLIGGLHVRNTIQVRLKGEHADCSLNGLYVGGGKQVLETHTLIDHQKPHGSSREFYKGILDGESQGIFDGLVVVSQEAQKTDSAQMNKNLLLSSKARAHSVPELKILANDVKCKHGSTIGQLDAQQLFYLRSRGISQAQARQLLIYAFASEMIELVESEELKATLLPCLSLATSTKK